MKRKNLGVLQITSNNSDPNYFRRNVWHKSLGIFYICEFQALCNIVSYWLGTRMYWTHLLLRLVHSVQTISISWLPMPRHLESPWINGGHDISYVQRVYHRLFWESILTNCSVQVPHNHIESNCVFIFSVTFTKGRAIKSKQNQYPQKAIVVKVEF